MKIEVSEAITTGDAIEDYIGNVYPVRGGRGARLGHMHVIISAYRYDDGLQYSGFVTITIDREGNIVGGTSYATHYFMNKQPIAICRGLDELTLSVVPL
jgi:hypothetical protein